MKSLQVLVLILYSIATCSAQSWTAPSWTDTLKNPVSPTTKILLDAKKIYESCCWTCHGLNGKGNGPAAINLDTPPADHTSENVQMQTDGALYWKITKGNGQMLPFEATLTKEQRWKLVSYIRQLGKEDLQNK